MNVFVVENSAAMDEGMRSILSGIPNIEVVGHAVDELDAIEQIDALLPDAVILDLVMQSGSGISVLENIKKRHAWIKAMVLTHYSGKEYAKRCMSIGADYFFDKSFQLAQVRNVLRQWARDSKPCPGNKPDAFQP